MIEHQHTYSHSTRSPHTLHTLHTLTHSLTLSLPAGHTLTLSHTYTLTHRYLSAMGFAFDGYAQAEFSGVTYSCSGGLAPSITGFLPEFLPNTPILRSDTAARQISGTPGAGCVVELDSILNYFDLHRKFGVTVAILFVYLAVLHLATFLGQLHLTKQEKR